VNCSTETMSIDWNTALNRNETCIKYKLDMSAQMNLKSETIENGLKRKI